MTASAAAYYEVRYREIGTESWSAPQRFNPTAELTIVGLDRDKDYEAEVRAVSACGAKSAWVPENYTTPGDPAGTIKLADVKAAAEAAGEVASDAAAEVAAIIADSVLAKGEKGGEIRRHAEITAELSDIRAKADSFSVSRTAFDAAHTALTTYLAGLSPAWNDVTQNTPIVAADYRSAWNGYYTQRTLLLNAIAAKAKALADAAQAKADTADGKASDAKAKTDLAIDGPTGKIKTGFLLPRKIAGVNFDGTADIAIPLDNIGDGTNYRRVGSGYVDTSGRVNALWDGSGPRPGSDVWTGASRAIDGLDAGGLVKKDIPGARMKYADGSTVEAYKPAEPLAGRNADLAANLIKKSLFEDADSGRWATAAAAAVPNLASSHALSLRALSVTELSFEFANTFPVVPGERYDFYGDVLLGFLGAGASTSFGFRYLNQAGGTHSYARAITLAAASGWRYGSSNLGTASENAQARGSLTVPAGAVQAQPVLFLENPVVAGTDRAYWTQLRILRVDPLRIAGSGKRIGDQRNLPQSNVNSFGSVPSTTVISATSTGAISINAHTAYMGGSSVAYSAVANAITGKAQSTTWVVYCLDPDYAGGAQTWLAAGTVNEAMQAGDGVYVAGIVTIPTSGTGSGGTGGDGDPDLCMDYDSYLPDGRLMRDLVPGRDYAWCVDVRTGERELVQLRAMGEGYEDCYLLASPRGCVIQSVSTPMDLPDGRVVRTPDMLGELVVPWAGGTEPVDTLIFLGRRRVLKPDFGDRMVYAGIAPSRSLATHNVKWKP